MSSNHKVINLAMAHERLSRRIALAREAHEPVAELLSRREGLRRQLCDLAPSDEILAGPLAWERWVDTHLDAARVALHRHWPGTFPGPAPQDD